MIGFDDEVRFSFEWFGGSLLSSGVRGLCAFIPSQFG